MIPYYSTGTLHELELDGYCDYGFPIGSAHHEYYTRSHNDNDDTQSGTSPPPSSFSPQAFAMTLPRVSSSKLELQSSRLDEVIRAFARAFTTTSTTTTNNNNDNPTPSMGERRQDDDIDVAQLLCACRAHLELMRSVGGSALCLVAKDLENNVRKVESVLLVSKTKKQQQQRQTWQSSPTLPHQEFKTTVTSILEYERSVPSIHVGNVLGETSAAMGLLWIRRSLAFQSHLFESLIPTPMECSQRQQEEDGDNNGGGGGGGGRSNATMSTTTTPREAAYEAYQLHLAPYHGWMLRTAFPASLSQMPDRNVFLAKFGEVEVSDLDFMMEYKIVRKLQALVSTLEPLLMLWKDSFVRLDLEDTRKV